VRLLKGADAKVEDLAFSPDGSAIATAYVSFHGVYLWNLEAFPLSHVRVASEEDYKKGSLFFSSDARSLSWLTPDAYRRTYNRDTRKLSTQNTFATNKHTQETIQTPDGSRGVSRHELPDYRLFCWRLADDMWVQTGTLSIADSSVENLTLSADGKLFAMLTRPALGKGWENNPRKLEVHEATTAALRGSGEYPYKYGDKFGGRLLFSPDSHQLVGFNNMNLLVWSIPERGDIGEPRKVRNTTRKQFTAMAYHPSGRHLYVTSNGEDAKDATVHVFDTATWARVEQFSWKLGNMKAIAVSSDGTLAAAGSERGDIVIWDVDL
jgi:WD40 repeat protein